MDANLVTIAEKCLNAAYDGTMNFPQIVGTLIENGFESYHVDYLRGTATYYLADSGNVELVTRAHDTLVSGTFQAEDVQSAIKEAQQQLEGYTYAGFSEKIMRAGCAGYIVSFAGKRAVYFGRSGETHVEHFPR